MVRRARRRVASLPDVRLWEGSVTAIPSEEATYDQVLDFGILHHVPAWRAGVAEIARVLRPGGRLFAEEPLVHLLDHWTMRVFTDHPSADLGLFDEATFYAALEEAGLRVEGVHRWGRVMVWVAATRR